VGLAVVVVGVAAVLRLWELGDPARIYFDETYYAEDARDILDQGVEEGRAVHPPVGKLLIAAGIALFGWDPFGWRIAGALAGILTVALTHLISARLVRSPYVAALAPLLVAVDGLTITMSRIAMLDVFLGLFVAATAWCALLEVQRLRGVPGPLPRPLWWTGLLGGLAVATKWSGAMALVAAGLVLLAGHVLDRRERGASRGRALSGALAALVLPLVLLPPAVYAASYTGWFVSWEASYHGQRACEDPPCTAGPLERARSWVDAQVEIAQVHGRLEATHPYRSGAAGWLVMERPVLIYLEQCTAEMRADGEECAVAPGNRAKILAIGNPALWWPALAAYAVLAWQAVRRRNGAAAFLLAFLAVQFVPWLLVPRPGYLFYMTPVVPFMALAVGLAADVLARSRGLRRLPAVLAVLAVAACAYFLPLWLGVELSADAERHRIWFSSWR
jgi:dolichyl-phosphate-mannose-protein mannosyltransferase